jgi:uncharacterized cupin superfamily protein
MSIASDGFDKRFSGYNSAICFHASEMAAKLLEIGNSDPVDRCVYWDIDMIAEPGVTRYRDREGTPYPPET